MFHDCNIDPEMIGWSSWKLALCDTIAPKKNQKYSLYVKLLCNIIVSKISKLLIGGETPFFYIKSQR